MNKVISVIMLTLFLVGCAANSPFNRSYVSKSMEERTDFGISGISKPGEFSLPANTSLSDGLTQDEAVAIALWNNAQFLADLAALGFARADLLEASLLPNPVFSIFFPVGPKKLETKLNYPFEILWQHPRRVAAAKLDVEQISENLINNGLGLVRDVHYAFTDLQFAQEKADLAEKDAKLRSQIADITEARLRAGDISELEASVARIDARRAEDAVIQFSYEITLSQYRLCNLIGLGQNNPKIKIIPNSDSMKPQAALDELLTTAFASRPDLRAAELMIEAAGKRAGWEQTRIVNLIGIIDGKDKGEENITVGPGAQIDIPIFNQSNGKAARAQAELEQTALKYAAARHRIILEVQEAYNQNTTVQKEFEIWNSQIVPSLLEAVDQSQKAYATGDKSYLFVLETMRQLNEALMRQADLKANLQKAAAQLNYSVGRKIN